MKIEINKLYQAKFKNSVTEDKAIVEVEKLVIGLTGMEVKLKGYNKLIIASGFVNMFERR